MASPPQALVVPVVLLLAFSSSSQLTWLQRWWLATAPLLRVGGDTSMQQIAVQ